MSLDPQAELIINLVKQAGLPEFWQLTPPQAREQYAQRVKRSELKESIHRTEDRRIPGLAGDIPIRIYWPRAAKPARHPWTGTVAGYGSTCWKGFTSTRLKIPSVT